MKWKWRTSARHAAFLGLGLLLAMALSYLFAFSFSLGMGAVLLLLGFLYLLHLRLESLRDEYRLLKLKSMRTEAKAWYFESIIAHSGHIIFTTDIDHRILKFNPGSEKVFGLSQSEAVGREAADLFEDRDGMKVLLRLLEERGSCESPQIQAAKQDGAEEEAWISLTATRLRNREGAAIGSVFNCSNITGRKRLEEELKEKNEQLLRLSITDALTGLFNVRHLGAEMARHVKAFHRYGRRFSVAVIDVDHFKTFNDTRGHQAGDQLLVALAQVLAGEIRQDMDSAYRYGGDEFVVVLPETRLAGARVICERILGAFRKLGLEPASLSIGMAEFEAAEAEAARDPALPAREFLKRADAAMYRAKARGGNALEADPAGPVPGPISV